MDNAASSIDHEANRKREEREICLVQVRLRTEVPHTQSSARSGFELMTSR